MPSFVFKVEKGEKTWYLIWSTIVDAPLTFGTTEAGVLEYGRFHGDAEVWKQMLDRAKAHGSSRFDRSDLRTEARWNRAGPEESVLSYDEIVHFYCEVQRHPTAEELRHYREGMGG